MIIEKPANKFYCKIFILLLIPLIIYAQGLGMRCPPSVHHQCGGGYRCAMVRHGRGPPVPDCISIEEAMLLEQALIGAPTGPGTGIGKPHRRFPLYPRPRRPFLRRRHQFPIVPHHLSAARPHGVIATPGVIPGLLHLPDGRHVHVPVQANSVRDNSERIHLNLTIHNENNNRHDQRGSGNVQVSQVVGSNCTPCGPNGFCEEPMICVYIDECPDNLGCKVLA